jgi:hypothetical protein
MAQKALLPQAPKEADEATDFSNLSPNWNFADRVQDSHS